ncbi:hypothetical protein [Pacificoceanicola onchidii]|uniref:hypothetical protein n=1 Tax=Pacificoceanicola onchidii TaxID=2562685 RepID=UPI0010A53E02|nr:hypothetical protein [Pacificoceanicola onchidii]
MNIWIFVIIQAVISVMITFALFVVILTQDMATGMNFLYAFLIGQVLSIPAAFLVYKRMNIRK